MAISQVRAADSARLSQAASQLGDRPIVEPVTRSHPAKPIPAVGANSTGPPLVRPEPKLGPDRHIAVVVASARSVAALARPKFAALRAGSGPWIAMTLVGLIALVAGSLWGWQQWNTRSSPLLDDLVPLLPASDLSTSATVGAGVVDDLSAPDRAAQPSSGPAVARAGHLSSQDPAPGPGNMGPGDMGTADMGTADMGTVVFDPLADPTGPDQTQVGPASETDPSVGPSSIVVHVSGAVHRPGVVQVEIGSRVFEAIAAAGGPGDDADTDRVNLAAPLVDGERVHIPFVGQQQIPSLVPTDRPEPAPNARPQSVGPANVAASGSSGLNDRLIVDINSASTVELEQLPGVGPAIARAISDLRSQRGPYATVDELLLVGGIGPAKLESIRPHAWVSGN